MVGLELSAFYEVQEARIKCELYEEGRYMAVTYTWH
jgi:hypothetical protein